MVVSLSGGPLLLPPRVTSAMDPQPPKHVGGILLYVRGASIGLLTYFELRSMDCYRMAVPCKQQPAPKSRCDCREPSGLLPTRRWSPRTGLTLRPSW